MESRASEPRFQGKGALREQENPGDQGGGIPEDAPPSGARTPTRTSELGVWGSDPIQHAKGCEDLPGQTLPGTQHTEGAHDGGRQQHRRGFHTELPGAAPPSGGGGSSRLKPTSHQRLTVATEFKKDLASHDMKLKISRIQSKISNRKR